MTHLADHIERFKTALIQESAAYRRDPCDEEACEAATSAVHRCIRALAAVEPHAGERAIYAQAMAAAIRWWAISEGAYSATDTESIATVRLIEMTLANTDFDALPWLWHERGALLPNRPTPIPFAA